MKYKQRFLGFLIGFLLLGTTNAFGQAFITSWVTTDGTITIPTTGTGYNYDIIWANQTNTGVGDGSITGQTGDYMITGLANGDTYQVEITGDFPRIFFDNGVDKTKIKSIDQWGSIAWTSMVSAFHGCSTLGYTATDAPDLSGVISMERMFQGCTIFNGAIGNWNTSTITNMNRLFQSARDFNGDITTWDVSMVRTMEFMFQSTDDFQQPIGNWNTMSLESIDRIFQDAEFNQPLNNWNVSNVTNMQRAFRFSQKFNQPLNNWNTSKVTNMSNMFEMASKFDQSLGDWDMSSVSNLSNIFNSSKVSTASYDNTLIGWSSQTLMTGLTLGATGVTYCTASTERQKIIDDFSWTIDDAGIDCTIIWDGSSWSSSPPTATDDAWIDGDFDTNTDGDITANTLTVNSTFTLTIADGDKVELAGDLANSGTVLVQNNGALVQTKATPSNSGAGTYTVERLADKSILVYNYFASPVIGETVADIFATNGTNFYSFNVASQGWTSLSTATVLGAGDGFAATGNGNSGTITRTFTSNTGFNSGDITKAITIVGTGGAGDDDWNLVGNPYPSGLDFQSFYTTNSANIGTAIYLWDSDGNDVGATNADYATMTSAGTVNAGAGGTTGTAIVASGQGFFIEALNNANITFSNSHRSATNNVFFRTKSEMQRIWLSAKHEDGASNQILIAFTEDAAEKSDIFDGKKRSESETLSFYMPVSGFKKGIDSEKLAIQGLPSLETDRIVPLGIEAKEAGEFSFGINNLENFSGASHIYLHDALNGNLTDLRQENYTINLEKGEFNKRFSLEFIDAKVTDLPDDLALKGVSLYSSGNRLFINFADAQSAEANIAVYDLQGRQLFATSVENQTQVSLTLPLSGIFIVKVETQRGVVTKKIYLD